MTTVLSVRQVCSLPPDQRAKFVEQNLSTEDDNLNIANITGWEDLPEGERLLLALQLL